MGQTLLFSQKYIHTRYSENLAITRLYGFLLYLVIARFCSSTTVVVISIFILYCYTIVAGQLEYDYYQLAGAGSPRFVLCCVFSFVYLHGWMLVYCYLVPWAINYRYHNTRSNPVDSPERERSCGGDRDNTATYCLDVRAYHYTHVRRIRRQLQKSRNCIEIDHQIWDREQIDRGMKYSGRERNGAESSKCLSRFTTAVDLNGAGLWWCSFFSPKDLHPCQLAITIHHSITVTTTQYL